MTVKAVIEGLFIVIGGWLCVIVVLYALSSAADWLVGFAL